MQYQHRIVSHCMGAWKWGYPRGERHSIVRYRADYRVDGTPVWISDSEVCGGITAANEEFLRETYPDAFAAPFGSIHYDLRDIS